MQIIAFDNICQTFEYPKLKQKQSNVRMNLDCEMLEMSNELSTHSGATDKLRFNERIKKKHI